MMLIYLLKNKEKGKAVLNVPPEEIAIIEKIAQIAENRNRGIDSGILPPYQPPHKYHN